MILFERRPCPPARLLTRVSLVLCLGLSACWSTSAGKTGPVEVPSSHQVDTGTPEADLLDAAKKHYSHGLFSAAQESFQTLLNSYPVGPYAEFAEIKLADAHFSGGNHEVAASLFESFIQEHPGSAALPYAILMAAESHQRNSRGLGRDPSSWEKAVEFYDSLLKQYPDSVYSAAAAEQRKDVQEKLAAYDSLVADFYKKFSQLPSKSGSQPPGIEPADDED